MKKIIALVVLLLNINFNIKEFKINFSTGYKASAQCVTEYGYNYSMYQYFMQGGPPVSAALPPATGSGTTPSWWASFTSWIGISASSSIGQLFNGQNITTFHTPSQYPGFGGSIYPPGYFNQYNNNNTGGGGSSSTTTGIIDCFGVDGGTAKRDVCGACVGGTTGADSCNKPNTTDTLKPIKIPCAADAVARDTLSDYILDFIKETPIMKNARDSAPFRTFEVGFSISRYSNPAGTAFSYQPKNYNNTGASQSVSIIHYANAVSDLHVHPDSTSKGVRLVESPSPVDFGGLIENYFDAFFIKKFDRRFIVSGGTFKGEYALVVSDTTKLRQFNLLHPFDSTFNVDTNSPTQGNWKGSTTSGFYKRYIEAYNKFKEEGYPTSMLETYANVYLLKTQNLGIVIEQKINGKFKELSFVEETEPVTNVKHYRIKICD